MTENVRISLSELRKKGKFQYLIYDPLEECRFKIEYKNFEGLPAYFFYWGNEEMDDVCSNNAIDIIHCLNEYYDVVLIP